MVKFALLARLEARPGKEADVEQFLKSGLQLAEQEPGTQQWYGVRFGPTSFGIFDTFENEQGRQAHLSGKVAQALMAKAPELFSHPPSIEQIEILAAKVPG